MSHITIPILTEHNHRAEPIGWFKDGVVTLENGMTEEQLYRIFGNMGFRGLEFAKDSEDLIIKFQILEWSK